MRAFIGFICAVVIVAIIVLFALSATPAITLPDSLHTVGQATPVTVEISAPHGLSHAVAWIEQNGERYQLASVEHPKHRFRWHSDAAEHTLKFTAGAKGTPQLKDGSARVIVEATSNDF